MCSAEPAGWLHKYLTKINLNRCRRVYQLYVITELCPSIKRRKRMKLYIAILLMLLTEACHPTGVKNLPGDLKKNYLVSADAKGSFTADELKQTYGPLSAFIKNGYTAYRVTYNTVNADGIAVVASGAIYIPDTKGPLPLLNYDHGTLFPAQEKNAPSYLGNSFELGIGKLFSAAGYLVVMPDYTGYGSTKDETHPYGAYHIIAASVIDMLRAAKELCDKNNILLSGKNFFSGWSEGAAVALATVKSLEEDHKGEFTPTATVLNAGPYYTSGFADYVLNAEQPLTYMKSYIWILRSYNRVYHINKPLTYYFNEPAATDLREGREANIPKDPKELFTGTFLEDYKTGKDTALQNAMLGNDLWDWKPASRIVFCHGDKDEYVPLFNSEKAYTTMKAKGADVTLNVFKGQTHSSGIFNFMQQAFANFEKAR